MVASQKQNPLNFILLGRSGCGKGTQAQLLAERFSNIKIVSTGDLMRDLTKQNTDVGQRVKEILQKGGLPYDDLATALWMYKISYLIKNKEGIICDGFPRRLNEAKNLDKFLKWIERKERTKVLLLDISEKEAYTRLKKRAREDDADLEIRNRLGWYQERTVPVIDYYKKGGRLIRINGEQTIEAIHQEILTKIGFGA